MKTFLVSFLLCSIFGIVHADQVATPTFDPASGVYTSAQTVTLDSATSGAAIAYTTDGSLPTVSNGAITHGNLYSGAISIDATTTVSVIAFKSGYLDSGLVIGGYTIQAPGPQPIILPSATTQVAAPSFSPAPFTSTGAINITISTTTSGATIRYTTDGSTPSETNGTVYSGQIYLTSTTTLNAIAYETSFTDSPVTSGVYTINLRPVPGLSVIHNFDVPNTGLNFPYAGLIQGSDGNFYGTTYFGGTHNAGSVFKMTSAGVVTTLTSFFNTSGEGPQGDLIQGTDGNFYGTTTAGGTGGGSGNGTIFKITPAGVLTTLVSFSGTNGQYPFAGLVQGSDGNFYGTTRFGGSANDGTVFKMTPSGTLTSLLSFTGSNGANPEGRLVQGNDGNFYGTTKSGGSANDGTVFSISSSGVFNSLASFSGSNGANPIGGLALGSNGNFYGTTFAGGDSNNDGTVFMVTSSGTITSLHAFNSQDGSQPIGALIQGSDGNFYGTTSTNTIFRITPAGVLTSLATFNVADGGTPSGGLFQGSDGNFYGTTQAGGTTNGGVAFQFVIPSAPAAPSFSPAAGTYTSSQTVTISTATSGASIVYTTDGSTPVEVGGLVTHGTLYSSPVSISSSSTLTAIAFSAGINSTTTSGSYTISAPAPAPTAAASGGGGGGAPSYWFLGLLAITGIVRWNSRRRQHAQHGF